MMLLVTDDVTNFQGWDDPYVPRTHEGLLKWKYPEMNSVDFLFEVYYHQLIAYNVGILRLVSFPFSLLVSCSLLSVNFLIFIALDRLMMIVSHSSLMNEERRNLWKGIWLHSEVSQIRSFSAKRPSNSFNLIIYYVILLGILASQNFAINVMRSI